MSIPKIDGNSAASSFRRFFGAVLFLFVLSVIATPGQDTVTGAFQGTVFSSTTGTYIGGAAVEITSESTGVAYNLIADANGRFYQGLLAPGWYQIRVSVAGYKARLLRREIRVSVTGEIVPVPVPLDPEPPGAPATAPALEPADDIRVEINAADARRDASFKADQLERLPLGGTTVTRTFDELALLAPGVAPPPQTIGDVAGPGVGPGVGTAGQFAVNGLRSRGNNFTVDGSDNNDEDVGVRRQGFVALVPQPVESVQEFQIITLLAPAQFGRNIGGQVNIVSKGGGKEHHGNLYGFLNSDELNARDPFDTVGGGGTSPLRTQVGQPVLLDGSPIMVRNDAGRARDPFTFVQGGGTVGGPIIKERMFYFLSGEYQKINATREKSFAVPTVEQRGAFGTGASGVTRNFFNGSTLAAPLFPVNDRGNAVFSLFPFPNDPTGVYGANTFTQSLPASGRGVILSGRLDNNFAIGTKPQALTVRYNFTEDRKNIPAVNEALFSTVLSKIQTHNLSIFLNSPLRSGAERQLLNQVRFSFGSTRLDFNEVRDTGFLVPSDAFPEESFYLNAPSIFNISAPGANGRYSSIPAGGSTAATVESRLGPLGQVVVAGFSPIGTDVYNFPQKRTNRTYQLADEMTWRADGHSYVFGFDTRRTQLDSDLPRLTRTLLTFNGAPRLSRPPAGSPCPNGGIGGFCFPAAGDPNRIIRPEDLVALGAASNSLLTLNVDRPDSKADLGFYQLNFYGQDTWRIRPELSLSYGLRYEYNAPVREADQRIESTFGDPRLSTLPVLQDVINGRTRLYEPDRDNFGPRVGVAYSPELLGGGRATVFRGGYGIFYDQVLGAVANQSRNVFPTFLTLNLGGLDNFAGQTFFIRNPATHTLASVPIRQPGTINTFNAPGFNAINLSFNGFISNTTFSFPNAINVTLPAEDLEMPMAHHYSFTFEQQLSRSMTVSAAYVGTSGRHLLRFTTPNLGSSLTVAPTGYSSLCSAPSLCVVGTVLIPSRPMDRPRPGGGTDSLGALNRFETTASSNYNAFQTELRGRFRQNLNFQVSYTLSKVTDDVSDVFDLAGAYALPQNSLDLEAERGPANFDVRHRWTYDMVYSFPKAEQGGFIRYLTDGLQIASTGRFHSGQPFTVNSVIDVNLDGNLTDRLDTTEGIEITGDRSRPLRLTATDPAILLAPFGQSGRVGRNSFRAGNVLELDLSVIKSFSFGPRRLNLRADIFNLIDRANYGVPVRLLEAPGFGRAVSTVTPGRRVQFSLKYEF
jgi:hypothetical protein